MALFNSHNDSLLIPITRPSTKQVEKIIFTNGVYETYDDELIKVLRSIAKNERRSGGNQAITEAGGYHQSAPLSGYIELHLNGFSEEKLFLHEEPFHILVDRLSFLLGTQEAIHAATQEPAMVVEAADGGVTEETSSIQKEPVKPKTNRRSKVA